YDRADAMAALGILHADRYASQVAKQMQSDQLYLREAAAWSIVMMEAKQYAADAIKMCDTPRFQRPPLMGIARGIPEAQIPRLQERFDKSLEKLKGLLETQD